MIIIQINKKIKNKNLYRKPVTFIIEKTAIEIGVENGHNETRNRVKNWLQATNAKWMWRATPEF